MIDKFILNKNDVNKSMTLAAPWGGGAYLSVIMGSHLPDVPHYIPTFLGNGKVLAQRVAEIGLGTGVFFVVHKKNKKSFLQRKYL